MNIQMFMLAVLFSTSSVYAGVNFRTERVDQEIAQQKIVLSARAELEKRFIAAKPVLFAFIKSCQGQKLLDDLEASKEEIQLYDLGVLVQHAYRSYIAKNRFQIFFLDPLDIIGLIVESSCSPEELRGLVGKLS